MHEGYGEKVQTEPMVKRGGNYDSGSYLSGVVRGQQGLQLAAALVRHHSGD